jgi:hypothetical protein
MDFVLLYLLISNYFPFPQSVRPSLPTWHRRHFIVKDSLSSLVFYPSWFFYPSNTKQILVLPPPKSFPSFLRLQLQILLLLLLLIHTHTHTHTHTREDEGKWHLENTSVKHHFQHDDPKAGGECACHFLWHKFSYFINLIGKFTLIVHSTNVN